MMKSFLIITLSILVLLVGCSDPVYTPKPRMYPRVPWPTDTGLVSFVAEDCPFSFEYPSYMEVKHDKYFYEDQLPTDCWFNMSIPALNGTIHCSYHELNGRASFDEMVQDAFTIVSKHNIKANARKEIPLTSDYGVHGLGFEISGPVATPYQFYVSDTTDHFFRASLYFNNKVSPDSMKVVHDFLIDDMKDMIQSFRWER